MLKVTAHAILRYQERVEPVSDECAREILSGPLFQTAAKFGARYVRLGTGQRIVIEQGIVKTVLPTENYKRNIGRIGRGRFGKGLA